VKYLKKCVAIFLLVSLTAPFLGTYIFLQHKKNKIRKEIAGIILDNPGEEDLVLLKFTLKEAETRLNWKHAGEFEFNGRMFDIARKIQEGDTIRFYCYDDEKETSLNKEKHRLIAESLGQDPGRKSQAEKIASFMKSVFRQDAFTWKPYPSQPSILNFSILFFNYSSLSQAPPSPPPKLG
jgi:hypothetical protein